MEGGGRGAADGVVQGHGGGKGEKRTAHGNEKKKMELVQKMPLLAGPVEK